MQLSNIKRHLSHRNRAIEQQNTATASKCSYQIEIDLSYFEKVSIGNPYGVLFGGAFLFPPVAAYGVNWGLLARTPTGFFWIASKCSYRIEIDLSYFEKVSIGNPYGVHDDTKKARKASSRAVDALNDIAIDYLATLSLKSAIILSHSGT